MKNRFKKLFSTLFAAAMLVSTLGVAALAADTTTITVGDASANVSSGAETVTVPVSISGNTGFASMVLTVSIPDGCTATSVALMNGDDAAITGNMFLNSNLAGASGVVVAMASTSNLTDDGVLFWITYEVSRTAENGSNALELTCTEFYSETDLDTNQYASIATTDGTLTVSGSAGSSGSSSSSSSSGSGTSTATTTTTTATTTETAGSFTDVASGAYYYDAVQWAVSEEITSGLTSTTFGPDQSCTRAQAVTFLYRAAGEPDVTGAENPFTDVSSSDYYYNAVLWAVAQGITSGTTATTFSPNDTCTRSQIVTFLYRQAGQPAVSGSAGFADVSSDEYYASAVAWAVNEEITSGTSDTTFAPNNVCTRGQIVTFLYRAA